MVSTVFTRPPDLPDRRVAEAVRSAWLLPVDSVEHVPVGFGSHHWVVTAAARRWFVTVDAITARNGSTRGTDVARLQAALATAHLLHDLGLTFVVSPILAANGDLLSPIGELYVAALYPYVDGETFDWGPFADRSSLRAVLDRLVTLHTAPLHAGHQARADDFQVPGRDHLEKALADPSSQRDNGVYAQPTGRLLSRQEALIKDRFAQFDSLAADVMRRLDRSVVTHGEPHRANTIVTAAGVALVDWDTLLIAPPERDLWWLAREDVEVLAEYEHQTGTPVDPAALDLYQLRWDLTDVSLFAVQLLGPHDDDADARTAWQALAGHLEPA